MGDTTTVFDVREVTDGVRAIDIQGDVTPATEAALTAAFEQAGDGAQAVVLNFAGMAYMNSGGIGLLVTLLVRAQRAKQRLLAVGLSDHYRQILALTRLDEAIEVVESEDEATSSTG